MGSGNSLSATLSDQVFDPTIYPPRQNIREHASRVGESAGNAEASSSRSADAIWSPSPGAIYDGTNASAGSAAHGESRTPAAVSDFGESNSALAITRKVLSGS